MASVLVQNAYRGFNSAPAGTYPVGASGGATPALSSVAAGDLLLAAFTIATTSVNVTGVTDSSGNTWTEVASMVLGGSGCKVDLWACVAPAVSASSVTVSVTIDGTTTMGGYIAQINNASYTGWTISTTATGSGNPSANATVGTVSVSGPGVIVAAAGRIVGNSVSAGTGFTLIDNETTALPGALEFGDVTTSTATSFVSANDFYAMVGALFLGSSGGSTAKPWVYAQAMKRLRGAA